MKTLLVTLALSSLVLSCDDEHEGRPAECKEIIEACHSADPGSGPIHMCHENAEEMWSQSQCASNRTMCLNLCRTTTDGGSSGG
jgi:hypothetical protein